MRLIDKIPLVHKNSEWVLDGETYSDLYFVDNTHKMPENDFNNAVEMALQENAIAAAKRTAARQALLDKLGITEDEARLLLS